MNDRRAPDPRIEKIVDDVAELKREMTENTVITKQVAELLTSFRVVAAIAKWLTVIAAAFAAVLGAVKAGQNFFTTR